MAKTLIQLKREYWSQPEMNFTPKMVEVIVAEYGEKPATSGEAAYVLRVRSKELFSPLAEWLKTEITRLKIMWRMR